MTEFRRITWARRDNKDTPIDGFLKQLSTWQYAAGDRLNGGNTRVAICIANGIPVHAGTGATWR